MLKIEKQNILVVSQTSQQILDLAIKHNTTKSTCGYITCAVCEYLAMQEPQKITPSFLHGIKFTDIKPYIEKSMKRVRQFRQADIKKYEKQMSEGEIKKYLVDWVANYEIQDYFNEISQTVINKHLYFFRQVIHDHPHEVLKLKWQEKERAKQQQTFKGKTYFYTSFNPLSHNLKENFNKQIQAHYLQKVPFIIAMDVLGHFNTMVVLGGQVYILDSLISQGSYDQGIHNYVINICKHRQ